MPSSSKDKQIQELKMLSVKCDDFIKHAKSRWEKDLSDSKSSYQKACSDLEKFEVKCQREIQKAIAEGYNDSQMETMKMFQEEERASLKKMIALDEEAIKSAQDYLDKYPSLLEGAKADQVKIEMQLKALGVDSAKQPGAILFNLVFWIVVLLLIVKACS